MIPAAGLVKADRVGAVATLVLNRPERHNSLIPQLLRDLLTAFERVAIDDSVRAVVLAAEGRSFSTGGDVKEFRASGAAIAGYATETVGLLNEVIVAMLRLRQPIVTAVHGMVTGGSIGLVLASDVVLMAPEAIITPWYSVVGFSPDGGWTAMLPDLIGRKRVSSILLSNRSISATDAMAWGIADEIVAGERIRNRALSVAADITERKPGLVRSGKVPLNTSVGEVEARLEEERRAFVEQITTPEAKRGMASFLDGSG